MQADGVKEGIVQPSLDAAIIQERLEVIPPAVPDDIEMPHGLTPVRNLRPDNFSIWSEQLVVETCRISPALVPLVKMVETN